MTAKHLANIAIRILGALWVIGAVSGLPSLLAFTGAADAQSREMMLGNGVSQVFWLVAGVLLFRFSERIAASFFKGPEELTIAASAQQLQRVGFSLLAVYLGIAAASQIAGLVYLGVSGDPSPESPLSYLWHLNPGQLVSAIAELVICIALFFGSDALSSFWSKLRARGEPKE